MAAFQAKADGRAIKRINYRQRKRNLFFACIVALPIIQFSICYIYVNLNSFILAFQHYEYAEGGLGFKITFAKFENFAEGIELISERLFMFKQSLILFFWQTIVGLTLALLFAYYIYKGYPMRELFRVVLFIPKIMSGVVFCLLFKYIANDVYVYIAENVFHATNVMGLLDNMDTKFGAVIFFSVWVSFGIDVLMFSGAMSGIDESVVESAHLDGANTVQEFIFITVPSIWPTFISFFTIHLAALFTNQMHLHTLFGTQAGELSTLGYYLYVNSAKSELITTDNTPSFSVLSAIGLMMTAIMLPLTISVRKALRKFGPSVD